MELLKCTKKILQQKNISFFLYHSPVEYDSLNKINNFQVKQIPFRYFVFMAILDLKFIY